MKTILCPVDLTVFSDLTARYAAQIARDTRSRVVLVAASAGKKAALAGDWSEDKSELTDRLEELHDILKGDYQVACGIQEEVISDNVYKRLNLLADEHDITILGMHSNQRALPTHAGGLDLIKMIRSALAPLLIVPEGYEYARVRRLLYAFDYKHEPTPPMNQLRWLTGWFGADLKFVSVIDTNMPARDRDNVAAIEHRIAAEWPDRDRLVFENIAFDDVTECLELYANLWKPGDLMVLSVNHRNMLEKIWHQSLVKRLLKRADHPYLIIHK
ncbi:MAG TPA: universal stress protein [Cyclobacteriaceae bacterium]|nr:universal stress protein [Cyclobacteriaceae bacterium]